MKTVCVLMMVWLVVNASSQAQSSRRIGEDLKTTAPEPTADYIAIYQDAVKALNAGNLDEAQQQADLVVDKYPHYKPAVNLQTRIAQARRNDPSGALRRRLDRIVIPRVNFRDALVESACDFLRDEARRLDPEKKGVSIVLNVPDHVKKKKITLDLVDVSAGDLLKYITEVAGLKYRIDRSVVMITSDEPSKSPETPVATMPDPLAIPNASP